MAFWKIERGPSGKFVLEDPTHFLDIVALISIAASPGVLLLSLVPLPLVLPVFSIVSFVCACATALIAHFSKVKRDVDRIAHWEIAYAFTFMWVAAGILGNPRTLLEWLNQLATAS
jgi:hypothetical protein